VSVVGHRWFWAPGSARALRWKKTPAQRRLVETVEGRRGGYVIEPVVRRVWGAQTRSSSRGHAVLVNQSAELIPSAHAIEPARSNDAEV
jgi:hypothetical protein